MVFNIMTYLSMQDKIKFQTELNSFEQFLETFPMPMYKSFILSWKAKIEYWNGDLESALKQLDLAIESSKQSIVNLQTNNIVDQYIFNKAEILYELGNHNGALEDIDFILNRNPLFVDAHVLSAKIYQAQNNTTLAQSSIQKAKDIWKDADEDYVGVKKLENF